MNPLKYLIIFILSTRLAYSYEIKTVNKLLNLTEQNINIAQIALELSQEFSPSLNINEQLAQIEKMASGIRTEIESAKTPREKIRILNQHFFGKFGLSYDLTDPTVKKADNRFLDGLLASKRGSCITLPLLYVSLAQKLGLPIYPVLLPSHIFVRYITPIEKINIEVTSGGKEISNDQYIKDFNITKGALAQNAYLKELSYKEYLSELVAINAIDHFYRKKDFNRGLKYMSVAITLRASSPELHRIKGQLHYSRYKMLLRQNEIAKSNEHLVLANQLRDKAKKLGFIRLSNEKYLK